MPQSETPAEFACDKTAECPATYHARGCPRRNIPTEVDGPPTRPAD